METTVLKTPQKPIRKIMWPNLLFFIGTTLFGVFGSALYLFHFGISLSEILLFAFYVLATIDSITVGYHRLFSHVSFKAEPIIRFLTLFFGAASFEQSALIWASQHRKHHRYVDTDLDPYNIKRGFFYAHLGWMIFWQHADEFENVQDLQKSRLIMSQHRHYALWAICSGILLPVLIGALTGHAVGAFLLSFCARVTFVYHITWCINSFAHTFGKATYDIDSTAKDNWFAAFLTNGEGYHNYHHRFPGDYRNDASFTLAELPEASSGFPIRRARPEPRTPRRLDVGDTAGWKPALRSLRTRSGNKCLRNIRAKAYGGTSKMRPLSRLGV